MKGLVVLLMAPLAMGASTGRLVADLTAGREPAIDMSPYRADRF